MFKFIGGLVVFIIVGGALGLGYLGFLPGVSDILGTSKPRDLGVTYTAQDLARGSAKLGIAFSTVASVKVGDPTITYSGAKTIDASFTSAEMTALYHSPRWYYAPFTNITLKVNTDGTAEASGTLRIDRLAAYVQQAGVSASNADQVLQQLAALPANPPFYLKGRIEIADNKVVLLDFQTMELGRFSLPFETISTVKAALASFLVDRIKSVPNLDIKTLRVDSGQLTVKATAPASVTVATEPSP